MIDATSQSVPVASNPHPISEYTAACHSGAGVNYQSLYYRHIKTSCPSQLSGSSLVSVIEMLKRSRLSINLIPHLGLKSISNVTKIALCLASFIAGYPLKEVMIM